MRKWELQIGATKTTIEAPTLAKAKRQIVDHISRADLDPFGDLTVFRWALVELDEAGMMVGSVKRGEKAFKLDIRVVEVDVEGEVPA